MVSTRAPRGMMPTILSPSDTRVINILCFTKTGTDGTGREGWRRTPMPEGSPALKNDASARIRRPFAYLTCRNVSLLSSLL